MGVYSFVPATRPRLHHSARPLALGQRQIDGCFTPLRHYVLRLAAKPLITSPGTCFHTPRWESHRRAELRWKTALTRYTTGCASCWRRGHHGHHGLRFSPVLERPSAQAEDRPHAVHTDCASCWRRGHHGHRCGHPKGQLR